MFPRQIAQRETYIDRPLPELNPIQDYPFTRNIVRRLSGLTVSSVSELGS